MEPPGAGAETAENSSKRLDMVQFVMACDDLLLCLLVLFVSSSKNNMHSAIPRLATLNDLPLALILCQDMHHHFSPK